MLSLTVLALISLCHAQRADDPNASTTINEELKKQTLSDVERKASEGDAAAQFQLALGYMVGGELTKDDKLAAKWCTKAAVQENVAAETTLGYLYSTGRGVKHSDKEALRWWHKAADLGSADAEFNLGEFHLLGLGTKRDYAEALKWFRKAAEQGESDAQYHLGLMYEAGNGVAVDTNEALRWYRLSAAQGFADARVKVDEYAKRFPPQHEFSLGDQSLSIDRAIEQAAQKFSSEATATDRVVQDDIAFPADAGEYRKLGKRAILLIAAVTHDPAELPSLTMSALSNTFLGILLRALRRARHFALVEAFAFALPTKARSQSRFRSGNSIRPIHLFGHTFNHDYYFELP
ncbi:MAG TPA: tetratricopeptide repeat protein, partial [Terriglobales bacterium]|nr:tetratricopeptide repeat protein [Terriglobales bacterium]